IVEGVGDVLLVGDHRVVHVEELVVRIRDVRFLVVDAVIGHPVRVLAVDGVHHEVDGALGVVGGRGHRDPLVGADRVGGGACGAGDPGGDDPSGQGGGAGTGEEGDAQITHTEETSFCRPKAPPVVARQ